MVENRKDSKKQVQLPQKLSEYHKHEPYEKVNHRMRQKTTKELVESH